MVYTVTFNPAIDYVVGIDDVKLGETNRAEREELYFGGKGINVSVVLKELGITSVALGFIAGFTGEAIEKGLSDAGIRTDLIKLKAGNSRINIKLKSAKETEINGRGPDIDEESLNGLFERLKSLSEGDILVLAGSIPPSLSDDIYERIMEMLSDWGIRFVCDASGRLLLNVLKYKPFLVKPNKDELADMFGVSLNSDADIEKYARELKKMGAVNVLISMAGDGAILIDEYDRLHKMDALHGKVINSVGAGDSMVAGFIAGFLEKDYEYALKLGTACGGATAFSKGLATKEDIDNLINDQTA